MNGEAEQFVSCTVKMLQVRDRKADVLRSMGLKLVEKRTQKSSQVFVLLGCGRDSASKVGHKARGEHGTT